MRKHLAFGVIIIRKIVFVFCIFVGIYGIVHKAKKKYFVDCLMSKINFGLS